MHVNKFIIHAAVHATGTIDNIIKNIMDLMICTRWQLTAIATFNGIFLFITMWSNTNLSVINVQTVRTNDVEHTWQFLADAPMQLFSMYAYCCFLIKIQEFKLDLAFVNTSRHY